MSRCCEVTINVSGHDINRFEEIVDTVSGLGYEANVDTNRNRFQFDSEVININSLC